MKEIEKISLMAKWFQLAKSILVDQNDARQGAGVIYAAIQRIKESYSLFAFPEGTRNNENNLLSFKAR